MISPQDAFGIFVFKRGKKYEDFYEVLVNKKKIFSNMANLFFFAASIGYKKKKKESFENGLDMRAEHLTPDTLSLFYIMFINDKEDVSLIKDQNELRKFLKNDMVEYAEAGLKYLAENVLQTAWNKNTLTLREDYDEYLEDIMTFVKAETNEDAF